MDEITVIEIVVAAKFKRERWEGTSFWLWDPSRMNMEQLTEQVAQAAMSSGRAILEPAGQWKFKITGRSRTLRGPLAQAMRHHLNRVAGGDHPPFDWVPVVQTWVPTGEDDRNG